jgi:hypothetical protein
MKKSPTRGTGDPNRPRPPDNPEQSKRFEEKARELGVDESGEAFERVMDVVVPAKPAAPKRRKPPTPPA